MGFRSSNLSQENILRDVHDVENQSLRVSAFSVPPPGSMEVIINHADDSIRIGDGSSLVSTTQQSGKTGLDVNVINALSAEIAPGTNLESYPLEKGTTVNIYNEVSGVAQGAQTTIVTYTVPSTKRGFLSRADYSGSNIATYDIQINGVIQDKKRTNYGVSLNDFSYFESNGNSGLPLKPGDVVSISVFHDRPNLGDFNARILVIEVNN